MKTSVTLRVDGLLTSAKALSDSNQSKMEWVVKNLKSLAKCMITGPVTEETPVTTSGI